VLPRKSYPPSSAGGPVNPRLSLAWPFALGYVALVVYASLFPFSGWRDQGIAPWSFLLAPWPRYWTGFDVVSNLLGYVPLGLLLTLALARSGRPAGPAGSASWCRHCCRWGWSRSRTTWSSGCPRRSTGCSTAWGAAWEPCWRCCCCAGVCSVPGASSGSAGSCPTRRAPWRCCWPGRWRPCTPRRYRSGWGRSGSGWSRRWCA